MEEGITLKPKASTWQPLGGVPVTFQSDSHLKLYDFSWDAFRNLLPGMHRKEIALKRRINLSPYERETISISKIKPIKNIFNFLKKKKRTNRPLYERSFTHISFLCVTKPRKHHLQGGCNRSSLKRMQRWSAHRESCSPPMAAEINGFLSLLALAPVFCFMEKKKKKSMER